MIEILKGTFTAGEVKTFHVNGEYFELLENVYPVDVVLLDKQGAQLSTMRDAEASFFNDGQKFQTIQITSATPQTVRFIYGDGSAGTRRTAGVVSVVDGNLARTLAIAAFLTSGSINPATAANNGAVQLWNKSSDKALVIDRIWAIASAVCGFNLRLNQVQLSNPIPALSKLGGGGASASAEIRTGEGTSWTGAIQLGMGATAANQTLTYDAKTPIVLPPGWGLTVQDTLNTTHTLTIAFEHVEIQR